MCQPKENNTAFSSAWAQSYTCVLQPGWKGERKEGGEGKEVTSQSWMQQLLLLLLLLLPLKRRRFRSGSDASNRASGSSKKKKKNQEEGGGREKDQLVPRELHVQARTVLEPPHSIIGE